MTIKELINALQVWDENTQVIVSGYEYGVDDVEGLRLTHILRDQYQSDFAGRHEETRDGNGELAVYIVGQHNRS